MFDGLIEAAKDAEKRDVILEITKIGIKAEARAFNAACEIGSYRKLVPWAEIMANATSVRFAIDLVANNLAAAGFTLTGEEAGLKRRAA